MKTYIFFLLILLLPLSTFADDIEDRRFNIGIGAYALKISYNNAPSDDDFSGIGLSASYAFTDNFSLKGALYFIDHKDFSSIDVFGLDMLAYVGTGLASEGFKAYIGGGLFSESRDTPGLGADFGGLQISGGVGYNWHKVAVDLVVGIRDSGNYEDFNPAKGSTDVVTGSILLSARF